MSNMRTRNFVAAIVLLLLSIVYGYLTANLTTRAIENTTQPSFFPWLIVACAALLSLSLFAQGLLAGAGDSLVAPLGVPRKRLIYGLVLSVVYLAALPSLGFPAANLPLFAGLMMLYGERRPFWIIGGSVVVTMVLFYLFREVFQILLPAGILEGLL